jgi:hypothetical protein
LLQQLPAGVSRIHPINYNHYCKLLPIFETV